MESIRFDKRSCLRRAHNLLAKGDDALLRYVCLELRFCLEAVMYDKLRAYAPRLPASIYAKWQPPQALKALLQIEPRADHDYVVRISRDDGSGKPSGDWAHLGTHQTLKLSRLRKLYNQLGNYLHVPSPSAQDRNPPSPAPEKIREDLSAILEELEPVVASTIDGTFSVTISFACSECESTVVCNEDGLRESYKATCLNVACGAEFSAVENSEGEFEFRLLTLPFQCINCKHQNLIETRRIVVGYTFMCSECGVTHGVVEPAWAYGLVDSEAQAKG
jgi:hypothetical protein